MQKQQIEHLQSQLQKSSASYQDLSESLKQQKQQDQETIFQLSSQNQQYKLSQTL